MVTRYDSRENLSPSGQTPPSRVPSKPGGRGADEPSPTGAVDWMGLNTIEMLGLLDDPGSQMELKQHVQQSLARRLANATGQKLTGDSPE